MTDSIYDISFERLVELLLPNKLRKPMQYYFLLCLVEPLKSNLAAFNSWRNNTTYKLHHTGQVIYLEKVLNDFYSVSYDPANHQNTKQIYISDGEAPDRRYIHLSTEQNPLFISGTQTTHIRTHAEYQALYSDFIINVPSGIVFNELQMRAMVDYYKLAGKLYKVKIV